MKYSVNYQKNLSHRMVNLLFPRFGFLIALVTLINKVDALEVIASIDANSITVTDVFAFKIEAKDADENPRVDISSLLDDFSIVSGPAQQTKLQWINGRMSTSRSLTWTLLPTHIGTITIPALPVKVGSRTYRTKPIQMKVSQSKDLATSQDIFLTIEIDKNEAYIGEQITVIYKLYTKLNMSISDVQFPDHVGFWTEELFTPRQVDFRDTQVQSVRYKVATLYKIALFPTKLGEFTLSPLTVKCQVEVRKSRRRRSIWDDPFFDSFDPFSRQTVPKVLRTKDVVVKVIPYPEGQPADFTNAVGQYRLSALLDTSTTSINEAVTFRINLTGTGNISLFSLPELNFPQELEVFPPTSTIEKEPFRDDITGTIKWEYILIPRQAGRFTIPAIDIPYFNPGDHQWHRTSTRPLQISIVAGKKLLVASSGHTKEEVVLLGKDIRYIRDSVPIWLRKEGRGISGSVFVVYSFAILLYFIPGFLKKVRSSRFETVQFRQSKKALKKALRNLKKPQEDPFSQTVLATYHYLHEKFQLSTDKLDPLRVQFLLTDKISATDLNELIMLLKTCDQGRFAPGAGDIKDTLIPRTCELLRRIDAQV